MAPLLWPRGAFLLVLMGYRALAFPGSRPQALRSRCRIPTFSRARVWSPFRAARRSGVEANAWRATKESMNRYKQRIENEAEGVVLHVRGREAKPTASLNWRDSVLKTRQDPVSESLEALRSEAETHLERVVMPHKKQEPFRHLSLRRIYRTKIGPNNGDVDRTVLQTGFQVETANRQFVFVDGVLSEKLSRTSDELPEGVYVGGMENIPDEIKDQVLKEASKVPADMYGSEYWAALNKYMMRDIAVIYVPEDTVVKDPIQISFYTTPSDDPTLASASFPRLVIISGKNSDAQALVYHTGAHNAIYHSSPSTTVNLAEGSTFNMYYHQEQSEEAIHTEVINATLADKSTFIWTGLAEGGTVGRLNMDVDVIGDDANVELWGASLAPKGAEQDLHTAVLHYGNSGHSVQEQRTIVGKKGHGVFRGQMKILSESFYTEVDQQSKALLLSPDGEVDAMPTLVVSPDKVEGAAHGSTVSDLGGEEMFYMMCRGVSESDAKAMLTKGFIRHIVGRFPFSFLRARNIEKILRMAERASVQWRFTEIDKTEGLDTMERDEEMAQFM